jgi:hypothetical protein
MTTTLEKNVAEKTVKHIDVNLEPCYSEDCAERCTIPGKVEDK